MNNKIAIAVTVLALVGVFIINQEPSKSGSESSDLSKDTQPKMTTVVAEESETELSASQTQPAQLSQQQSSKKPMKVIDSDSLPLPPPPPPVRNQPMASPANDRGVVSHPNHQAPIQAPISRSTPRKE